jgi:hypothetical protein
MEEPLGLPIEAKNRFPQNNISGSFEEIVPEYILSSWYALDSTGCNL